MSDLALRILLQAQDQASSAIKGVESALGSIHPALGAVASVAIGVGEAVIGIGEAATKMAGDYDQGMRMVKSLTGSSDAQMRQYDTGLKTLAEDAGVAPDKLTKGLYNVLSASYKGTDAMRVFTLATEDSKIGMTDASVTTDALTNVLRSFNVQSKNITNTNGEMLQTVTLGKATFEQYAQSIVKSASSANQFHESMETMNAAWATMTSSGIRAAQASTDFQQSLKVMDGNIGTVVKSLHSNKIAFDEAKFNAMDYGHKIVYLNDALEQANAKHVKVTGVTLQAAQAVSTIAKHIGDYNSDLTVLSDKQAMANKTQQAWAITQGGLNQSMDRMKASLDVMMISLGQKLLPVLTPLISKVADGITKFAAWAEKNHVIEKAMTMLGAAIGAVSQFVQFLYAQAMPPLIAAWKVLQDALTPIMPELQQLGLVLGVIVVGAIIVFVAALVRIVQVISGVVATVLHSIVFFRDLFTGNFKALGTDLHGILQGIVEIFRGIFGGQLVDNALSWGRGIIQGIIDGIKSMIGAVASTASNVANTVKNFLGFKSPAKEGPGSELMQWGPGLIKGFSQSVQNALPILDAQMQVTAQHVSAPLSSPLQGRSAGAGTAGGGLVINVYIDGRSQKTDNDLVDLFMQRVNREMRRSGNFVTWTSGGRA